MKSQRIAIVGAGIGGLSVAWALCKAGFDVTVFEQAVMLGEVGAGIQLSPNASKVLHRWGMLNDAKRVGFMPKAVKISHWRSGKQIGRFPVNHTSEYDHAPYIHIHRADLYGLLLQALRSLKTDCLITGARLEAIHFDKESQVTQLTFNKDDTREIHEFDFVIGADGIHSKVREFVEPNSKPRFTGNVAWRGLVPVSSLSASCRPDPCANVLMGPGAHFVCYYVRGGDYVNYVAVVERDDWQEESWTLKAKLEEMMDDFSGWNAQTRDILSATDPNSCYRWALHDREPYKHWVKDQCVLLGDAAHSMLPFLAQGAAMAIEDAYVLAACLEKNPDALVQGAKRYEGLRKARATKVQLQARKNMKIYHARNPFIQFGRHQYLEFVGKTNPEYFNQRLAWLYDYEPDIQ